MTIPQPNFKGRQACKDQNWAVLPPRERTDPVMGKQEYDAKVDELKSVCDGCEVKVSCLMYALRVRVQGVWGGTTDKDRGIMRRKLKIAPVELKIEDFLYKPPLVPVVCTRKGEGCGSRKGGRVRPEVPGDAWDLCSCGGTLVRVITYMPGKGALRAPRKPKQKIPGGCKRVGNSNGQAKLNPAKVRELRELYESGTQTKDIAAKFGLNRSTVFAIVSRRTWSHVA